MKNIILALVLLTGGWSSAVAQPQIPLPTRASPSAFPQAGRGPVYLNGPHVDRLRAMAPSVWGTPQAVPTAEGVMLTIEASDPRTPSQAEALTQIINHSPNPGSIRFGLAVGLSYLAHPDAAYRRDPVQALYTRMREAATAYTTQRASLIAGSLPQETSEAEISRLVLRRLAGSSTVLGRVVAAEMDIAA